jgi:hypothetical protein
MRRTVSAIAVGLALIPVLFAGSSEVPSKRQAPKLPVMVASEPLYGIFVFGTNTGNPVWAVLDKSSPKIRWFDVLYLDLNADGDLTSASERFVTKTKVMATRPEEAPMIFEFPRLKEPGSGREHTDFKVTWRPTRVSANIKWLGANQMNAGYGTDISKYGKFATSPEKAPVYVLGHELPFQFQHWMSGSLRRGSENDFKVFMGNLGEGQGAFCAVDDKFLPPGDYVVATLIYKTESGAEKQERFDLKNRC